MNAQTEQNQPQILEKLTPVFRDILDNDALILSPEMTAANVEGWDSLAHIRIMIAVEDVFKMRFTGGEVAGLQNIKGLIALIARKQSNA